MSRHLILKCREEKPGQRVFYRSKLNFKEFFSHFSRALSSNKYSREQHSQDRSASSTKDKLSSHIITKSVKMTATSLTLLLLLLGHAMAQSSFKKNLATPKPAQCCDEVRSLKVQVANLSSMLEEMSKKQESDLMKVVRQMMEMEKLNQQHEARVTEAESKYSEIYSQIEIMQLQAAQSAPQQSTSGES